MFSPVSMIFLYAAQHHICCSNLALQDNHFIIFIFNVIRLILFCNTHSYSEVYGAVTSNKTVLNNFEMFIICTKL